MTGKNTLNKYLIIFGIIFTTISLSCLMVLYALHVYATNPEYKKVYVECPNHSIQEYINISEYEKQIFICGEIIKPHLRHNQDRFIKEEITKYINGIR